MELLMVILLTLIELKNIWVAVSRITNPVTLVAFALAALVIVMRVWFGSNQKSSPFIIWIILVALVFIGVGAAFYENPESRVYRVRVTVIDRQKLPIEGAKVTSSIGGEAHTVAGGAQFVIPAATIPLDKKVKIYVKDESTLLTGIAELQLGNDRNPAVTIQLGFEEVKVRGRVVDSRGKAISGAVVSVVGYGSEAVTTQADGGFELTAHASARQFVKLHIEKPSYKAIDQWHPAGDDPATILLDRY